MNKIYYARINYDQSSVGVRLGLGFVSYIQRQTAASQPKKTTPGAFCSMSTTVTNDVENGGSKPDSIYLYINPRFYQLPGAAMLVGTTIGLFRGSRLASLRFLAENAHRPPKTLQGWYYYKKTKNYRMMLGGLQEAGRDAGKLGLTATGWVSAEEALTRAGWEDVGEIGAGLFTASTFAAVCKLLKFHVLMFYIPDI